MIIRQVIRQGIIQLGQTADYYERELYHQLEHQLYIVRLDC